MRNALALSVLVLVMGGCLTPAQVEALDGYDAEMSGLRQYVERVETDREAGTITAVDAAAKTLEAVERIRAVRDEIRKIRAAGVPWWAILLSSLEKTKGLPGPVGTVGTVAAFFYAWTRRRAMAERDAVIKGVERTRRLLIGGGNPEPLSQGDVDKLLRVNIGDASADLGVKDSLHKVVKAVTGDTH